MDVGDVESCDLQPAKDWDDGFRSNRWDYLADLSEAPRYGVVAGYVHRLTQGGRILDAGCGEAVLIDYLDLNRYEYRGFDLSGVAIDRARRRHPGAALSASSVEDFAPPAGTAYDLIVFNEVLSQVEQPIAVLAKYYGFLKPQGHVIISQFRSKPGSRGERFRKALEQEIEAGRLSILARAETQNSLTGLAWTTYCLPGSKTVG